MAIVRQLRESYPWIADSLTAFVAGTTGLAALIPFAPLARGTLSAPRENAWEHPLRGSILPVSYTHLTLPTNREV